MNGLPSRIARQVMEPRVGTSETAARRLSTVSGVPYDPFGRHG